MGGAGLFSVVACKSASKTTMEPSGLSRYGMRRWSRVRRCADRRTRPVSAASCAGDRIMCHLDSRSPRRLHQLRAQSGSTIAAASRSRPACLRIRSTDARCSASVRLSACRRLCGRSSSRSASHARADARSLRAIVSAWSSVVIKTTRSIVVVTCSHLVMTSLSRQP